MAITPRGEKEVFENLRKTFNTIEDRVELGVKDALLFIQKETIPRTPIDTSLLRNSFYTKIIEKIRRKRIVGEIGNPTAYAVYVHEILEYYHPIGEAKFLSRTINDNLDVILTVLKRRLSL